MTILDAQPRGPPSGLSAQVQPPPTNLVLRLQLLQGEGTGPPSPGPRCARCGEEPAALPSATPAGACRGLSWPLPGRGSPYPTGLWCNQQGSACPCLDTVEHKIATVMSLPPRQVQEGLSACAHRPAPQRGLETLGNWPRRCLATVIPQGHNYCSETLFPLKPLQPLTGGR